VTTSGDRGGVGASWRNQIRRRPGGALILKAAALVLGAAFVALGFVLVVLPGPLTIPPIIIGLYILSLEFDWAERLFKRAQASGRAAWASAKAKPVSSAAITIGGLVLAGLAFWAVGHYDLVAKAKDAVGL
jgi:hypothetical protein